MSAGAATIPAPAAAAGRWRARVRGWLPAAVTALAVLVLWEVGVRVLGIEPILLPTPSAIAVTFVEDLPRLIEAVWTTGRAALLGLVLGAALGFVAGAVGSRWAWLRDGLVPFGVAFGAVPIVATAPIFNLWFGALSVWSNAAVVALVVFFPMLINTVTGLQAVPPGEMELMRSYAATPRTVFVKLRVPTALPFVFGALRVAAALAVIAAVVADFFGGLRSSAGFFIKTLMANADYTGAWATVAALCLFGLAVYGAVAVAEAAVLRGGLRRNPGRNLADTAV